MIACLFDALESVLYGKQLVENRRRMASYVFRAQAKGYRAIGSVRWGTAEFSAEFFDDPKAEVPATFTYIKGPVSANMWVTIDAMVASLPTVNSDDKAEEPGE